MRNYRTSPTKIKNNKVTVETKTSKSLIDFDKAKDQILTELALSSEFKNKLRKVIADRQVEAIKLNYDDIYNEVFIELCKKDAEYIFNQYVKNPNSILAIALTIAKTFFKVNPKYPDYPNKSIVHKLNYQSTALDRADWISPVDIAFDEDSQNIDAGEVLSDSRESSDLIEGEGDLESNSIYILEAIRDQLTDKERKKLDVVLRYFNNTKTIDPERATYKQIKKTHKELIEKIKNLISERGINNLTELATYDKG